MTTKRFWAFNELEPGCRHIFIGGNKITPLCAPHNGHSGWKKTPAKAVAELPLCRLCAKSAERIAKDLAA